MRPPESFIGQPVRSLQTMLRVLAEYDDAYPTLVPDGIYGPSTVRAVSAFQRLQGLPITGVTDQETWEAIFQEYETALIAVDEAYPLNIVLNAGQILKRGQRNPYLYVVQAVLQILAEEYASIGFPSHNGILDEPTSDSLGSFQTLVGLPVTGELDKHTWKHLALQLPLAANRNSRRGNIWRGL